MTNETKVGLLAVITIVASIIGYNFLKGVNVLNAPNLLYAQYENVASLSVSSPIIINGLQVGVVKDIYFMDDLQTIEVEMNIEKDYKIPKDAEAVITSLSIMGGTAIKLKYNSICNGPDCAQSGDQLKGRVASTLESFIGQPEELDPYFDGIKKNIGPITDTLKNRLSDPNSDDAISKSIRDIAVVLENLKNATANMNRMMVANSKPLNGVLKNAENITENLTESNQNIKGIMQNADSLTANLADLELEKTLNGANAAIASLNKTMASADQAVSQLTQLLEKINKGEGAIGKLMTDDTVITKFTDAAVRLDSFLTDFQKKPYRYMPLKSRKKVKRFDKLDAKEGN
jgi:phospholipid/cholesterol/gamma-HCH transport system substrate-binding protein